MRREAAAAGALACVLVGIGAPARAQTGNGANGPSSVYPIDPEAVPRPSLRALRVTERIRIDGRLEESAWAQADSAAGWITALPRDGYPATERSVARVLYDDAYLYVGAYLYDSDPDRLYSPGLEQDFPTHDADLFGVVFDTFLDRQNGVMFAVSPAGALFDAQAFNDSREVNTAWEGVIQTATAVHADGWSAELAIPLRTLRFTATAGPQAWGINFLRRVRRLNEDSYWAPVQRQFRVHKMSRAGTLTGLEGLRQGRNLAVKPYVKGAAVGGSAARALGQDGADFDAGLDVKYGITSRLTLDLTTFTDFSQVEVDQEQVNLTRFSLFFPEKRDFFLENDGIFTLGDVTERNTRTGSGPRDFKLFYSRSIGLAADRRPIPILGGVRLSGRAGATELGFLEMQTQASGGAPAENFAVLRLRQNFGAAADAGILLINRQRTSDGATGRYNRSAGFDANFRLLRYLLVNTYVAATADPDEDGDATSAYAQAAWRDPLWDVSAFVKHVGPAFNPEVGFIRRRGVRQGFATAGAHPQPRIRGVAEVNPYIDVSAIENVDGVLETRWLEPGFNVTLRDGGTVSLTYEDRFERLFEPTDIAGAVVPAGDYEYGTASASYQASGARPLSGGLRISRGDFYDGKRLSLSGSLDYRPSPHLSLSASAEHNDLTLNGRSFQADVFGARIRYAASTRLFASAFVQYVESSDELVSNLRINFIHAPLSDVFLVVTERRLLGGRGVAERVLTLKATRLVAF
jgi:Domain of unknown function (DUF5916)